jgi:hypothetical protein
MKWVYAEYWHGVSSYDSLITAENWIAVVLEGPFCSLGPNYKTGAFVCGESATSSRDRRNIKHDITTNIYETEYHATYDQQTPFVVFSVTVSPQVRDTKGAKLTPSHEMNPKVCSKYLERN